MEQANGKFKHCRVYSNTYFFKLWNPLPQEIVDIKRLYGLKEKSVKWIVEKKSFKGWLNTKHSLWLKVSLSQNF